jgi:hypothetical protein
MQSYTVLQNRYGSVLSAQRLKVRESRYKILVSHLRKVSELSSLLASKLGVTTGLQ